MLSDDRAPLESYPSRPWVHLATTYDVEAWMERYNRDLQQAVGERRLTGYGICFELAEGGEIYLHTTPEGDMLLDVTPEAEWAAPVIEAATRTATPASRIWALPGHLLTQLVFGLSSLIGSSRIVLDHAYRVKKW